MGSNKNAKATVAMTAVQMAKSICMESKKKNMTSKEIEAPSGKHMACNESKVWIPLLLALSSLESLSLASRSVDDVLSSSKARLLNEP